jgi:multidrug efflux system outer membrane protein
MRDRLIAVLIATSFLTNCTVGPNYHRPSVQAPQAFHAPEPLPRPQAASFADLTWWQVFRDEELQSLIKTALEQN